MDSFAERAAIEEKESVLKKLRVERYNLLKKKALLNDEKELDSQQKEAEILKISCKEKQLDSSIESLECMITDSQKNYITSAWRCI